MIPDGFGYCYREKIMLSLRELVPKGETDYVNEMQLMY